MEPGVMRTMSEEMEEVQLHKRRPTSFREVLLAHANTKTGRLQRNPERAENWMLLVTKGVATDPAACAAVAEATQLLFEHAERTALDIGYTPSEYNIPESPVATCQRGATWGDRTPMQTLYSGVDVRCYPRMGYGRVWAREEDSEAEQQGQAPPGPAGTERALFIEAPHRHCTSWRRCPLSRSLGSYWHS